MSLHQLTAAVTSLPAIRDVDTDYAPANVAVQRNASAVPGLWQ